MIFKFKSLLLSILSVLVTITLLNIYMGQNADYDKVVLDNWSCSAGRRQSPITLRADNSTQSDQYNLVNDNYKSFDNVILTFNDNLLEITDRSNYIAGSNNKGFVTFSYDGYMYKFDLEKIVVHVPSEHQVEGYRTDIEVEYIHKKDLNYVSTVNFNRKLPDVSEYLVVSTLYAVNGTNSDNDFLENLKNYFYSTGITNNYLGMNLDLLSSGIMRAKRSFFYKGSDTQYPCNESHFRIVIADIFKVPQTTVDFYSATYKSKYLGETFAKTIAPLNGRDIYRNFYANKTEFNSSNKITINLFICFLSFLILF